MSRGLGETQQRVLKALKALEARFAAPELTRPNWPNNTDRYYPFAPTWLLVLHMYPPPPCVPLAEYKRTKEYKKRYASVARALSGLLERGLVFHTKYRAPLPELPEPPELPEFYQSPFEHIGPEFSPYWKTRIPKRLGPREPPKLPEPYAPLWEGHGGWYTRQEFEAQWVEWNVERQPSPRGVIRGAPAWDSTWEAEKRQAYRTALAEQIRARGPSETRTFHNT